MSLRDWIRIKPSSVPSISTYYYLQNLEKNKHHMVNIRGDDSVLKEMGTLKRSEARK
ncbi:hypothetical protein TorRG33x02_143590 [Trema orientale]|uniref:Uncharacterized protein n=1 Tax=Trema orientale TaxID=63057 RepID=A0A2P5EWC2_TREOI|nr:hypothetical protein TorRG33x02_143590 [Trema orientale]